VAWYLIFVKTVGMILYELLLLEEKMLFIVYSCPVRGAIVHCNWIHQRSQGIFAGGKEDNQ
jgi:hypothetical protein